MPTQGLTYRGVSRTTQPPACTLTLDDLKKLFVALNDRTIEAATRQLATVQRPPETPEAEFARMRQEAISASGLTLLVFGQAGEHVVITAPEAIDATVLPDVITTISFDSALSFNARMNYEPQDRFRLRFDMTEPPGFNTYNPWEEPTPNTSKLEITGTSDSWVAGVHQKVIEFLGHRLRRRRWLHSSTFFNVINYVVGFPAAFWAIHRIDQTVGRHLAEWPSVLRGALYIYLFLIALLMFRLAIGGLRWLFPLFELKGSRSVGARATVGILVFGLLGSLVYDVLKAIAMLPWRR